MTKRGKQLNILQTKYMTRQFTKEKACAKGQKNAHEDMLSSSSSLDECKLKQGDMIFHLSCWQKLIGLITS